MALALKSITEFKCIQNAKQIIRYSLEFMHITIGTSPSLFIFQLPFVVVVDYVCLFICLLVTFMFEIVKSEQLNRAANCFIKHENEHHGREEKVMRDKSFL